jgi:acetyltransferase
MEHAADIATPPPLPHCAERRFAWRPGYDAPLSCTDALRDGTEFTIRPIRAGDKGLELAFLRGLSRESRYQRLLSRRDLLPGELRRLTEIDPAREMALIATIRDADDGEEQIGVARYVKDDDGAAEMAIVIGDAWQRRGLGEKLLQALIDAASDAGVGTLAGITFSTNLGMLRLAKKLGFDLRYQSGDATLMRLTRTT